MKRLRIGKGDDRGANLIEFAILMPFLLLLLMGIVEFSWLFSQNLDVRHGAREGARLVAVNYPVGPVNPAPSTRDSAQTDQIVTEICNRMDVASNAIITLQSTGDVGDPATATVETTTQSLTGFIDWVLPSSLSSTVEIRVEQPAGWDNTTDQACSP